MRNVVLDFDIELEFWFRNGWVTCKSKIKVDTHEIPFLIYQILLQYFRLSRTCCFCVKNISKTFLKLAVPELADISIKHVSRVLCEDLRLKSCVSAKKLIFVKKNFVSKKLEEHYFHKKGDKIFYCLKAITFRQRKEAWPLKNVKSCLHNH